jgi:hypothetical protein
MADPVIEEIHQTRRAISDRFNGDIGAIAADAAARQSSSGHPVWKPEAPNKRATSDRGVGGGGARPRPPPPPGGGGAPARPPPPPTPRSEVARLLGASGFQTGWPDDD